MVFSVPYHTIAPSDGILSLWIVLLLLMTAAPIANSSNVTTAAGFSFDPEADDPNWPGNVPKARATHRLIINLQYDSYPDEVSWTLARWNSSRSTTAAVISPDYEDGNRNETVAAISRATTGGDGFWQVEDRYIGQDYRGTVGVLTAYEQPYLTASTRYRFTIEDMDGFCCEWGNGWATLTTAEGVLWSLVGDELTGTMEVDLWVDPDGIVELHSEEAESTGTGSGIGVAFDSSSSPSSVASSSSSAYPPEAQSLSAFCGNLTAMENTLTSFHFDFVEEHKMKSLFEVLEGYKCNCNSNSSSSSMSIVCESVFRFNLNESSTVRNKEQLDFELVTWNGVDMFLPSVASTCDTNDFEYFHSPAPCLVVNYYSSTGARDDRNWNWTDPPTLSSCGLQLDGIPCHDGCQVCDGNRTLSIPDRCGYPIACDLGSTSVLLFEYTLLHPLLLIPRY